MFNSLGNHRQGESEQNLPRPGKPDNTPPPDTSELLPEVDSDVSQQVFPAPTGKKPLDPELEKRLIRETLAGRSAYVCQFAARRLAMHGACDKVIPDLIAQAQDICGAKGTRGSFDSLWRPIAHRLGLGAENRRCILALKALRELARLSSGRVGNFSLESEQAELLSKQLEPHWYHLADLTTDIFFDRENCTPALWLAAQAFVELQPSDDFPELIDQKRAKS